MSRSPGGALRVHALGGLLEPRRRGEDHARRHVCAGLAGSHRSRSSWCSTAPARVCSRAAISVTAWGAMACDASASRGVNLGGLRVPPGFSQVDDKHLPSASPGLPTEVDVRVGLVRRHGVRHLRAGPAHGSTPGSPTVHGIRHRPRRHPTCTRPPAPRPFLSAGGGAMSAPPPDTLGGMPGIRPCSRAVRAGVPSGR